MGRALVSAKRDPQAFPPAIAQADLHDLDGRIEIAQQPPGGRMKPELGGDQVKEGGRGTEL
jgi:hypothetical protein